MSDVIDQLERVFGLVTSTTGSSLLSAIGLILFIISIICLYKLVKSKPEETSTWFKSVSAFSLVFGVIFSAAGPIFALKYVSDSPIKRISREISLENLQNNEKIKWLIRLIPYDPNREPDLSVSKLIKIGPNDITYTFVGSYQELKGYKVEEAVAMIGGKIQPGQHVSAIIFSVSGNYPIIPANARGLLQSIKDTEDENGDRISNKFIKERVLNESQLSNLRSRDTISWGFKNYQHHYREYCLLAHKFRCETVFDAKNFFSDIGPDWHPLGAAVNAEIDACDYGPEYCKINDWAQAKNSMKDKFGARVFLIRNLEIAKLRNRYLIDFENPAVQLIPEIGISENIPVQ